MASTQHVLLSPAELAFLHVSLTQTPPIRPDGRMATQFRPLRAETGILPGANGSARVCFADGTEAIVGVKAEVEKSRKSAGGDEDDLEEEQTDDDDDSDDEDGSSEDEKDGDKVGLSAASSPSASSSWVEVTVEIPGVRDDDASTVFLAALLAEALLADGTLAGVLCINRRFHWKLHIDILLISPPLSYPLPLLSLTTHLALLATRLPRLTSEADEDPFFDDDWDASTFLYPQPRNVAAAQKPGKKDLPRRPWSSTPQPGRPPITLLVMTVGNNILFDPSTEELAVANAVLAVSVGEVASDPAAATSNSDGSGHLRLLAIRTIDPPSRLTAPGVPYTTDSGQPQISPISAATGGVLPAPAPVLTNPAKTESSRAFDSETTDYPGVWRAPRGGAKLSLLLAMTDKVLDKGGVAEEVFAGLAGVEIR